MLNYLKQNKNIFMAATGIFIVSMSVLMIFLNSEPQSKEDLKADVVNSGTVTETLDQEKSYRQIIQNQEDPMIVMGVDGLINYNSWDLEATTGYKPNDLKGQLFFNYINPDELATFLGAFAKVIESEEPVTMVGPYRFKDANGEYHYHMGAIYPIIENGKIVKLAITTRDITQEMQKAKDQEQPVQPENKVNKTTIKSGKKIRDNKNKQEDRLVVDNIRYTF
jgi:PAS domain S-box-containing protein